MFLLSKIKEKYVRLSCAITKASLLIGKYKKTKILKIILHRLKKIKNSSIGENITLFSRITH